MDGVVKTYAMLHASKERRAENIDIVIGLVETHGRKEITPLLDGLDILPSRRIEYRGTTLREFDLDAATKRNPILHLGNIAPSSRRMAGPSRPKTASRAQRLTSRCPKRSHFPSFYALLHSVI